MNKLKREKQIGKYCKIRLGHCLRTVKFFNQDNQGRHLKIWEPKRLKPGLALRMEIILSDP